MTVEIVPAQDRDWLGTVVNMVTSVFIEHRHVLMIREATTITRRNLHQDLVFGKILQDFP
jgi:hypothetical protein